MRISDWSSDVCSSDLNSLFVGCFLGLPDHVQQFAYCVGLTLCLDRLAIKEVMRSEEHTSELQSLMRISYAVFCLKKKTKRRNSTNKRYGRSTLAPVSCRNGQYILQLNNMK